MKFLEGKTPAERNKIIIAIVLGGVAVLALSYTLSGFFFAGTRTVDGKVKTPTPSPTAGGQNTPTPTTDDRGMVAQMAEWLTTPVTYIPTAFSGDTGRNVFAFYEPPAPTPWVPTPTPMPVITPLPTPIPPPQQLTYVTPSAVYAGSKGFRMEAVGDKFTPETRILFNGGELPTNFVNPQKLTADIPASLISGDGSRSVMVRTPDGKLYSNQLMMQVQAPPVPNYEYIGLIEKKYRNNDMAMLKEKGKNEVASFRLNDPVGDRFRLVSISAREVILEDRSLGFKHRLGFLEGKGVVGTSGPGGPINGGFGGRNGTNGPMTFSPMNSVNPTTGQPYTIPPGAEIAPGIPNPNSNTRPNQPQTVRDPNIKKKDYEDDDDGPDRQE